MSAWLIALIVVGVVTWVGAMAFFFAFGRELLKMFRNI